MKLRLATYNIRLGIQEGLQAVADNILPYEVDVVVLQEVGDAWKMGPEGSTTDSLAELLSLDGYFVPAIDEDGARYGTAMLTRHPVTSFEIVELPEDLDEPRRLAVFELETPDGAFRVLSTHLSWIEDREAQWDTVFEALSEPFDGPTFLMGDLNEEPDHWAIQKLRDEMIDADLSDALTFPSSAPKVSIDYIFADRGRFAWTMVVQDAKTSDHFPIFCEWSSEGS